MASWEHETVVGNESVTADPSTVASGPSQTAAILGAAVMLVFFMEGVIGNLWILFAVLSRRTMWNIINLFIVSLCFNELLTAGLIVVLIIDSYIWQEWTAGELMCKLNPEFTVAFTGCSLWHTAFIAIHRYIVVCHNDVYKQMSKTAYVTLVLVVTRLIPFACTFPGFSLQTSGYVPKLLRCILLPNQGIRIMTITMVQIVLPCIIVVLCYALVFLYVMKMRRQVSNTNLIQKRELKITKMFGMIFVMILMGFVPYAVVRNADKSNQLNADIYVIVTVFYGIATCSSPLIYGAMSTDIRAVCMSCISQCFCWLKCAPCERLRHSDRMLSLSQMADADVSPESNSRNVQVKDATTQIENGAVQTKNTNAALKCRSKGCNVLCEQEIEPLYNKARCLSIEEEDLGHEANVTHSVDDIHGQARGEFGTELVENSNTITMIALSAVNKNNSRNKLDSTCKSQARDVETLNNREENGAVLVKPANKPDERGETPHRQCHNLSETQSRDAHKTDCSECYSSDEQNSNSQVKSKANCRNDDNLALFQTCKTCETTVEKLPTEVTFQPNGNQTSVSLFKTTQKVKHSEI